MRLGTVLVFDEIVVEVPVPCRVEAKTVACQTWLGQGRPIGVVFSRQKQTRLDQPHGPGPLLEEFYAEGGCAPGMLPVRVQLRILMDRAGLIEPEAVDMANLHQIGR